MKAKITLSNTRVISKIDDRLYGSFIEHLGRAVYGGVYEPTHPTADDCGFRRDVLDLVRELNVPIVRYPGGNFVSGYQWEDGTGDRAKRPRRMELAWKSVETNEVGVDEFQEWTKRAGAGLYMAVNLGTRGPAEAASLVEYCNAETDTYYARKRRENGFEKPFGVKLWCLGNEMDGDWQIGHKTAEEYARVAHETAKMMKWVDPSIELVLCGSSGPGMKTFGAWERTVLDACYDNVDYISLHSYYGNRQGNTPSFLACGLRMENFIKDVAAICDEIGKKKNSKKRVDLSFDEWNVWFHSNEADKRIAPWSVAPPILEDAYTFEDALVVGTLLNVLIRNADRVKIACLAQLVNVIAPVMTENGGAAWRQTIFWPFSFVSRYGRGTSLAPEVSCPAYASEYGGIRYEEVPFIDASAVLSEDGKTLSVFAVNRSLDEGADLDVSLEGFAAAALSEVVSLECDDLLAVNTKDAAPVSPVRRAPGEKITLAPHSWNHLVYTLA